VKSNVDNSYLQATYNGIYIYKDIRNHQRIQLKRSSQTNKICCSKIKKNEIWAADNYKGLYRISTMMLLKPSVENITQKGKKNANDFGVKIFEFRNEILLIHKNGIHIIQFQSIGKMNCLTLILKTSDIVKIDEAILVLQRGCYIRLMLKEIILLEV
jgi:hypothetical protein